MQYIIKHHINNTNKSIHKLQGKVALVHAKWLRISDSGGQAAFRASPVFNNPCDTHCCAFVRGKPRRSTNYLYNLLATILTKTKINSLSN